MNPRQRHRQNRKKSEQLNKIHSGRLSAGECLSTRLFSTSQRAIVSSKHLAFYAKYLIQNPNLLPSYFSTCFIMAKDDPYIIKTLSKIKYLHPETQELLEKALLLL